MPASASSSQVLCGKHDVFISFRGLDVRSGFLSHLEKDLRQKNIDVYMDDRLERGEEIWPSLVNAIEGSIIALVIFLENFASSKWCLQELVKIMECKEANQQIVIPIFYHVDPSDVRDQKRTYADAFTNQKHKDGMDNLQIWRSILKKIADLSGYHSSNFQNEAELIDAIVKDVLKKLEDNSPIVPNYCQLVGFGQNFITIELLMGIHLQDVRILGIWGMGGIGKTTLARAIFENFLSKFESCCFMENVRVESTKNNGLYHLHQKLLSELIDKKNLHLNKNEAMRRLQRKKVLIVLDDVDDPKQLKYLAGQQLYLGLGSRVIATSRDKHVLKSGGIQDKYIHEVKELNLEESLELFSIHAFNQSYPNIGYEQLTKMTVAIAKGNPLALEVLGSHFHSRDEAYWESELSKLQKYPHQQIQNILKISYDGLDAIDREIFLDIAFFFMGEQRDNIIGVLEASGFKATSGIENLKHKALIKSDCYDIILMHDLIQEMAGQIVFEECMEHPERRSRLKYANEICDILKNNMGTDQIKGIILDVAQIKYLQLRVDVFAKMSNLRILKFIDSSILKLNNGTYIELAFGLDSFPNKLRYLDWVRYPLQSVPLGSYLENLVQLHMQESNVKKLWDGKQDLVNLKTINLRYSQQLMELPDLSMAHKLEIVNLSYCTSLSNVHPSILSLHTIVEMDVSFCSKLESLESETHLESLQRLKAPCCHSLKKVSSSSEKLRKIDLGATKVEILHLLTIGRSTEVRQITLDGERLRSLPIDVLCCLTNLEEFDVPNFKQVIHTMELHSLFDAWRNLTSLRLDGWSSPFEIPDSIKGLTKLRSLSLNESSVESLPANISHLSSLKYIYVRRCKGLKSILGLPPFLEMIIATECTLLETVSSDSVPSCLRWLCFHNCVKLDECSLRFIEELTHQFPTITTSARDDYHYRVQGCYPGSRVPDWMKYKQMTEASNAPEFTLDLNRAVRIILCCVANNQFLPNTSCQIYCDFIGKDYMNFCSPYNDPSYDDIMILNSDHVFLWSIRHGPYGFGTSNHAKISCELSLKYFNEEEEIFCEVPVDAFGVHPIYNSKSEPELRYKRKRNNAPFPQMPRALLADRRDAPY